MYVFFVIKESSQSDTRFPKQNAISPHRFIGRYTSQTTASREAFVHRLSHYTG